MRPHASEDKAGQTGPGQGEEGQRLRQVRDQADPPAESQAEDQGEVHGGHPQRGQDPAQQREHGGGHLRSRRLQQREKCSQG